MAAVIRVKRRIDEQPQNAFVLKKRKTDDLSNNHQHSSLLSTSCETNTILKFAGTVDSQDDSITSHISKLTKDEAKSIATKTRVPTNPTDRCRDETKQNSQENRFKIVNCYRAANESHGEESKGITVVDVESNTPAKDDSAQSLPTLSPSSSSALTSNQQQDAQQSSSNDFVYDIYLTDTNDLTEMDTNLVNDLLSVYPLNDDLYAGRYGDNGFNDESDTYSEDSNSESHWRNEYPDEDDEGDDNESIGEREMMRAVNNLDIDDDLSDDDSIGSASADDVNRYGTAYAKYKNRILNRQNYFEGVVDDDGDYMSELSCSDSD
ncbi:hypothetical protein HA402_009423 [Bradysia odoriphaga]|nr:hypothetical protein HA402_009423 [Bradysia odoriphaga]